MKFRLFDVIISAILIGLLIYIFIPKSKKYTAILRTGQSEAVFSSPVQKIEDCRIWVLLNGYDKNKGHDYRCVTGFDPITKKYKIALD